MGKKVTFSLLLTEQERQDLGEMARRERRRVGDALRLALYEALVRRGIVSRDAQVQVDDGSVRFAE
jgi:hypothetical protein